MSKPPVYIIGFPRCGSRSLCEAVTILGWNAIHNPRHWDQIEGHNAAGDVFVTAHWRELHVIFPQARFILNTRPFNEWRESLTRIPGFWESSLLFDRYHRHRVYGTDDPKDAPALWAAWNQHHVDVVETIPPERLLVFPQPFAWEPLCAFLGIEVPTEDFPWLNRGHCEDVVVRIEH